MNKTNFELFIKLGQFTDINELYSYMRDVYTNTHHDTVYISEQLSSNLPIDEKILKILTKDYISTYIHTIGYEDLYAFRAFQLGSSPEQVDLVYNFFSTLRNIVNLLDIYTIVDTAVLITDISREITALDRIIKQL